MIQNARQLKDLIRNLSKEKGADPQILLRSYMMERFLERVSLSPYKDRFILKGGMLVTAMVGVAARSTMDIDTTVKGASVNVADVEQMVADIIAVPLEEGGSFELKSVVQIMDEAEYPGVRASMQARFDGVNIPLKLDVSTGDAITPCEVQYDFKLLLEERTIPVLAYNLETVLAEKLETIITRSTANTRMRDFYDVCILSRLYGDTLSPQTLWAALTATADRRGTAARIKAAEEVFSAVEISPVMQKLWAAYQNKFSYAAELPLGTSDGGSKKPI